MDLNKFVNESLSSRETTIDVPELQDFFGKDDPKWTVRGLTAAELGRANESADKGQDNLRAMVDAMAGNGDKAEALRKAMGVSDKDIPQDVSRRISMLAAGSVEPKLGSEHREVAVKLAETFPTVFYNLTNKILELTGQGAEVGKRKASGKTPK